MRQKSDTRQISVLRTQNRYESHNDVSVNDGPHIRRWSHNIMGTAVAQWLRCCATDRKVAGPIPDGVIGIFY